MESTSEALKVHISQSTMDTLSSDYACEERGEISVKGKGQNSESVQIILVLELKAEIKNHYSYFKFKYLRYSTIQYLFRNKKVYKILSVQTTKTNYYIKKENTSEIIPYSELSQDSKR